MMRRFKPHYDLIGNTVRTTWVSSGAAPTSISSALIDKDETLVHSMTAVSSGGGMYYSAHTLPSSAGWYVNEWKAVIDGYPFVSRQLIKAEIVEAD
jgi:hypothetical protein